MGSKIKYFALNNWVNFQVVEITRETKSCVFQRGLEGREIRIPKRTSYGGYYDSIEEGTSAVLANIDAMIAEHEAAIADLRGKAQRLQANLLMHQQATGLKRRRTANG